MKKTGIVRKLDNLGRITIPIELRRTLQIEENGALEIGLEDNKIVLKKYCDRDIFTGETEDLIEYEGLKVSRATIAKLAELAKIK